MQDGSNFTLELKTPDVEEYRALRAAAGLTPRSRAAAEAGLPHNVAAAVVRRPDGQAIAMTRVIGDGLNYEVVDVAVLLALQGMGLGKRVMEALMDRLRAIVPAVAYVGLIADGEGHRLYAQFGFKPVTPASIGMAQWIGQGAVMAQHPNSIR